MNTPLISIITPIYNQSEYITEAIGSVLNQSYSNWELVIVNDGSTDDSEIKIKKYSDNRIKYYYQENKGVSAARNLGLKHITGKYFCFLDADDMYTCNSLKDRVELFLNDKDLSFVDGKVVFYTIDFQKKIKDYTPSFKGIAANELVKLNASCFVGVSWMIKKEQNILYKFNEGVTHGEDLSFYLSISKDKKYDYTPNAIMNCRVGNDSAMSNPKGLEKGYITIFKTIKREHNISTIELVLLKFKITKIMTFSYLKERKVYSASLVILKYLFI